VLVSTCWLARAQSKSCRVRAKGGGAAEAAGAGEEQGAAVSGEMMRVAVLGMVLGALGAAGFPAKPRLVTVELEGGCQQTFTRVGDAYNQFYVGPGGAPCCRDEEEGAFRFIDDEGGCTGKPITCEYQAREQGHSTWKPKDPTRLKDAPRARLSRTQAARTSTVNNQAQVLGNLVLLVKFMDHDVADLQNRSYFEEMFNAFPGEDVYQPGANESISLRKYFYDQSLGKVRINSTVTDWIEVDYTESEAVGGPGCHGACRSALYFASIHRALHLFEESRGGNLRSVLDLNNDGYIDGLTVIHSGFGAENTGGLDAGKEWIWSHLGFLNYNSTDGVRIDQYNTSPGRWYDEEADQSVKAEGTRVGVPLHEFGHFLGVQDLYDGDRTSFGLGPYCLMSMRYSYDAQLREASSISAPVKAFLGWLDVEEIPLATGTETFTLPAVIGTNKAFMLRFSETESYFIENRQPESYDHLHVGGILIYHVKGDMSLFSDDFQTEELIPDQPSTWSETHPIVRLIQPDGLFELETVPQSATAKEMPLNPGDWWPFKNAELSDATLPMPNLNTYAGLGKPSGLGLSNFSASGPVMTFTFSGNADFIPEDEFSVMPYAIGGCVAAVGLVSIVVVAAKLRASPRNNKSTLLSAGDSI